MGVRIFESGVDFMGFGLDWRTPLLWVIHLFVTDPVFMGFGLSLGGRGLTAWYMLLNLSDWEGNVLV